MLTKGGHTMNGFYILQSVLIVAGLLSISVGLSRVKAALKAYSYHLSAAQKR